MPILLWIDGGKDFTIESLEILYKSQDKQK